MVAALIGSLSSASAATAGDGEGTPIVGAFGLGDGLEGLIDERDGALAVSMTAAAGLTLTWDSRAVPVNRYGFGHGWGIGLSQVATDGGVALSPSSGGSYPADASHPVGLAGYPTTDVRFEQIPDGVVPARADGARGEVAYAFRLHELGGLTTYFAADGDPVARVSAKGQRSDWIWHPSTPHRLVAMVDDVGVVTTLDWADPARVVVRPGANLPVGPNERVPEWVIELDGGRLRSVVDPMGDRATVGYSGGLLARMSGASGADTSVTWQAYEDRVPRVSELRTADASGAELSTRTWSRRAMNLASGWPRAQTPGDLSAAASFTYETELSDGATSVRSTYGAGHTLHARVLVASSAAGERVVQTQAFSYPAAEWEPGLAARPPNWSLPTTVEVTHLGVTGAARTLTEEFAYDELGRLTMQTDADGTVTTTSYWADGTRKDRVRTHAATGDTTAVRYHWSGDSLLNESHVTDGAEATVGYLMGSGRHARTTPDGTQYFDADRHGNVVETTDEHGARTTAYAYTDYGIARATGPQSTATGVARNPFQYAGEFTHEDGTQPLGARLYDPRLMQFTTPDHEPLHNLRAYADLNPIMNVDPSGTTSVRDQVVNWVMLGVGVAAAATSIPLLAGSAALVGAPAIASFTVAVIGFAADGANLGITIAQLIKQSQPTWFGAEDHSRLDADGVRFASYGFAAAAAAGTLASFLTRGLSRLANPKFAKNEAFVSELKNLADDDRAAALRIRTTKNREDKAYFHGTKWDAYTKIRTMGFKAVSGSDRALYGPGAYFAKDARTSIKHYGRHLIKLDPGNVRRAMKLDAFRQWSRPGTGTAYGLRNPYWTKTSPFWVRKYLRHFDSIDEVEAYRARHSIQAVFIRREYEGTVWNPGRGRVLDYLRVPKSTTASGTLAKSQLIFLFPATQAPKRRPTGRW